MRRLALLRHAKSSWDDLRQPDHARPLNPRGQRDAVALAETMQSLKLTFDRVLCSTATRTRETWDGLAGALPNVSPTPRYFEELYLAEPEKLLSIIRREGEAVETLLVIGHNDGLHEFAMGLVGEATELALRDRLSEKFPTAALAVFDCPVEVWSALAWQKNRLTALRYPRDTEGDA
ncbi:MAG: SixA phosphatase family protein [Elstera sp.]